MNYFSYNNKRGQGGQVMLTIVILFLAASVTIVLGVATPIIKQVRVSLDTIHSAQSYYLAEGTLEDAIYRVENNKTVSNGDTVQLLGYTATVSVASGASGKTIDVTANRGGLYRKMEASVSTGIGSAFNYGIQSGTGGFSLSGGSKVVGNVYANGNIVANNGVTITGSAIAAPSASVTSDQSNSGTIPITTCTATTCLSFGSTTAAQDFAQSFKVSTASSPLHDVQFYIKKVGAPSDITVRIVDDSSGSPGTTNELTTNGTLLASQVSGSSFGWVDVVFPSTPTLDPAKTYWLVLDDGSNSATNYYLLGATNNTYANGLGKLGKYTSTWTSTQPAGLDSDFNLYLGVTTSIGGGTYVGAVNIGQSGVGDAWANTVSGASVAGSLYCQTGSNNNKACNTTRPDPAPTTMPLSDANIQDFKDEATTTGSGWTYTGNLTIGYQGTTTTSLQHVTGNLTINGGGVAVMSDLQVDGSVTITGGGKLTVGPLRVNGDLDVESTMSMTGTVYVLGNVTIGSGATLKLDAGYGANSGVLISDGYATVSGGSSFSGSGQSTSFPLLITTSTCPSGTGCGSNNAINFNGGAGAVVLVAQNGTINMSGGTGAEALTAKEIDVSGGATITYNSGLANLNFSSGPSGGWNITSWKEVQ